MPKTRRSDWDSFDDFNLAWHRHVGRFMGILYADGQFDELPYWIWEEDMFD